ncbi:uncharacterized protein [Engystomops pustulosus]|uniref:uncharacterized protein n=1 Tax=Engystomops pustulosus TaxID=76066 RepID=UPI003AFA62E0
MLLLMWEEVQSLLLKNVISPVPPHHQRKGFYSPLFLVQKPNGAYRMIINLKNLNTHIKYRRLKMESLKSTTPLIPKGAALCTIDLKDAYYHVPIHPISQKFLRFAIRSPKKQVRLPIQSSTIRDLLSSQTVHKNYGRGGSSPKTKKHTTDPLLRRSSSSLQLRRNFVIPERHGISNPKKPRLDYKSRKIKSPTKYQTKISGNIAGLSTSTLSSSRREDQEPCLTGITVPKQTEVLNPRGYETPGPSHVLYSWCSLGSKSHERSSELDSFILGQESRPSGKKNQHSPMGKKFAKLVESSGKSLQGPKMEQLASNIHLDRCKQDRLGSKASRKTGSRSVVPVRDKQIIKLQRTEGSLGNPEGLLGSSTRQKPKNIIRQHDHSRLSKTPGGHTVRISPENIKKDLSLGRRKCPFSDGNPSEGVRKQRGRFPEPIHSGSPRVVPKQGSFLPSNPEMGNTANRSICHQRKQKSRPLLLPTEEYPRLPSRCLLPQLALKTSLCLPSTSSDLKDGAKNKTRRPQDYLDSPLLAKKKLVPSTEEFGIGRTSYSPSKEGSPISGVCSSSQSRITPSISLDPEKQMLKAKGLSEEVIATLQASRKPVTSAIYHKIWKRFVSFCHPEIPNLSSPNIQQILEFLQAGLTKGLKTSTLKVQVSALSVFFDVSLADHSSRARTEGEKRQRSPSPAGIDRLSGTVILSRT